MSMIRNPNTNRMILVNGPTYKKVFKPYLIIPYDIIREILFYTDSNTIIHYHQCCKHIKMDKAFWQYIYKRDNIKLYEQSNDFFKQYWRKKQCMKEAADILTVFESENQPSMFISVPILTTDNSCLHLLMGTQHIFIFNQLVDMNSTFTIELLSQLLYSNPNLHIATNGNTPLRLKHLNLNPKPYIEDIATVRRRINLYSTL